MRAVVLSDNIPGNGLEGEWGLSIYITRGGTKVLLDYGASKMFRDHANALGLDLSQVDYAVLSHGHSDHWGGIEAFLQAAQTARVFIRPGCDACYMEEHGAMLYDGIPQTIFDRYRDRFVVVHGDMQLAPGIWLIPHKTPGLAARGQADGMYMMRDGALEPDDYAHEQSLVLETETGLVVFNSCSHGGADNILREAELTFPGKKLRALVGGFHLFQRSEEEVRELARRIRDTGVETVYTGHCTGKRALAILQQELGHMVKPFYTGCVMNF